MIFFITLYLSILAVLLYFLSGYELFKMNNNFVESADTEFRGINLLGDNSNDGYIACSNSIECRDICERNQDCKGYSFYQPGQKCLIFMSGDFVPQRPGFVSGKKLDS